jgi:hypothetical protein
MMPIPVTRSDQVFNSLTNVDIEDVDTAVRSLFQLRPLARQGKLDFTGRVALAQAALIAGYRDEALAQIDAAYRVREIGLLPVIDRLVMLFRYVADRDRAVELSRVIAEVPGVLKNKVPMINCVLTALWSGDVNYLTFLTSIEESSEPYAMDVLTTLRDLGMLEHWNTHQQIIFNIVKNIQMHGEVLIVMDDSGRDILIHRIFIDGTRADPSDVEMKIEAALDSYFETLGSGYRDYDLRVMTLVSESPRHIQAEGAGA